MDGIVTATRKLPLITPETDAFWHGGQNGQLQIYRCHACGRWFHPPGPICRECGSLDVGPEPVSGRGRVLSFTINVQRWSPDLEVPFLIAIVELAEQAGLRFVTNIVNCAPEDVKIDMPVRVVFLQQEDVWLPLFERELS